MKSHGALKQNMADEKGDFDGELFTIAMPSQY